MKNIHGYMVLSLGDIRELQKQAIRTSKTRYNGKIVSRNTVCINLKFSSSDYNSSDGATQVNITNFK